MFNNRTRFDDAEQTLRPHSREARRAPLASTETPTGEKEMQVVSEYFFYSASCIPNVPYLGNPGCYHVVVKRERLMQVRGRVTHAM